MVFPEKINKGDDDDDEVDSMPLCSDESEGTHALSSDDESGYTEDDPNNTEMDPAESGQRNLLGMLVFESSLRREKEQHVETFANRCTELERRMSQRDENILRLAQHCRYVEQTLSMQNDRLKQLSNENQTLQSELIKLSSNDTSSLDLLTRSKKKSNRRSNNADEVPTSSTHQVKKRSRRKNRANTQNLEEKVDSRKREMLPPQKFSDEQNTNGQKTKNPIKITCTYDPEIISLSALNFSPPRSEEGKPLTDPEVVGEGLKEAPSESGTVRPNQMEKSPKVSKEKEQGEHFLLKRAVSSLMSKNSKSEDRIRSLDARALENFEKIACLEEELQNCVDSISELEFELIAEKEERNAVMTDKENKFNSLLSDHESSLRLKDDEINFLKEELQSLRDLIRGSLEAKESIHPNHQSRPELRVSQNTLRFLHCKMSRDIESEIKSSLRTGVQLLVNTFWSLQGNQQTVEDGLKYFSLGVAQKGAHNYERALSLYHLALMCQKRGLGDRHPTCAATLEEIGSVQLMLGEKQSALFALDEAMSIYRLNFGDNSFEVSQVEDCIRTILCKKRLI